MTAQPEIMGDDEDRLVAILGLLSMPGLGPVRLRKVQRELSAAGIVLADALSDRGLRTMRDVGVKVPPSIDVAAHRATARSLRAAGIDCVFAGDADAEALSHEKAPPVLFIRGNRALLRAPGVGFCGSRDATERGVDVAADIAEQVAAQGLNVVSGGARGVDTAAHVAALAASRSTTIVLAEGLLEWRPRPELREHIDMEHTLIISEFAPTDRWLVGRAMQRNKTICLLSRAMVLIEARTTGGTFAAGETSLALGVPLFCAVYQSELPQNDGNRSLLSRGAKPLMANRATAKANIRPIIDAVRPPAN
jgi:DNA processing protein